MAMVLSHKQANSSALAAVIEIRLETAISEDDNEGIIFIAFYYLYIDPLQNFLKNM